MGTNGLDAEQQALLASIMSQSPQAGGGAAFSAAKVSINSAATAAPPADSSRMLSQAEIDALIASMA